MKSKIFISINIPAKIKKRLILVTQKWQDLPVKWIKEDNLHITLVFLSFVSEEVIPEICKKMGYVSERENIFEISFDRIELFPSVEEPRMIALTGEPSEELRNLINNIEKELGISNVLRKSFRPHITLGRGRRHKWEALEDKPFIQEKFSFSFSVESIDIMASNFDNNKNSYSIIESCPLR